MIHASTLLAALELANGREHPAQQAYINTQNDLVFIDGLLNLAVVADILNNRCQCGGPRIRDPNQESPCEICDGTSVVPDNAGDL